jgi:hypothetical protein
VTTAKRKVINIIQTINEKFMKIIIEKKEASTVDKNIQNRQSKQWKE